MMFRLVAAVAVVAGMVMTSHAQTISFNSPLPWVSLRNDTIIVRAQVDTAALKGKELSMSLLIAEKGKTTSIATKKFKLADPAGEFSFGKINRNLIGGEAYLKVKWNIQGTEEKGEIEPIGIADLTTIKASDTLRAAYVADNATASDVALKTSDKLIQLESTSFGLAWNKSKFYIVIKKGSSKDTLKVALDGKCGKNAFLSFPDRIISSVMSDSFKVEGAHFQRETSNNTLQYTKIDWQNEITSETVGDKIIVGVPWFDTGVVPFEERAIGMAAFTVKADGKSGAAIPGSAKLLIPATWGIVLLQK